MRCCRKGRGRSPHLEVKGRQCAVVWKVDGDDVRAVGLAALNTVPLQVLSMFGFKFAGCVWVAGL